MLRGSLSGADGLVIATDPAAGTTVQMDYTMVWPSEWMQENCHVLAVLTNTEGEVLNCIDMPWAQ